MYFFFFYPVGTDAPKQGRGIGTYLLVTTLLAVYLIRTLSPVTYGTLVGASFFPDHPTWRGAFLSLFLHGSWMHLIGNGLYLAIFGRQLESRLGFPLLALVFVAGGVAGCWSQLLVTDPTSRLFHIPVIGASGGVAALLGATLLRFHHQRVRVAWVLLALLGGITKGGATFVPTFVAVAFWFALQVVQGLVAWGNGGANTAYGAHAGGFLAGIALAILFGLPAGVRREVHRERGRRHFERGDWWAAIGELSRHLEIVPGDDESAAMRARAYVVLGQIGDASTEYLRLFRDARQAGDVERTAELYRQMRLYAIPTNLTESGLLKLAYLLRKGGHRREAAQAFLEIVNRYPDGPKAEIASIRRAELLWELGETEDALLEYERLLASHPESDWRELAEGRVDSIRALTGRSGSPPPSGNRSPSATPASPARSAAGPRRSRNRSEA
ncbi:MAG: rhomboid family intramembrane serine protease [Gemmatimonadetes bacterium]|nr:rhomboid family intramembrane serine protease [Gemmatimonadota bacterium]